MRDNRSPNDFSLKLEQGSLKLDLPSSDIEQHARISCELNEICLEVDTAFLLEHKIRDHEKLHLKDTNCRGKHIEPEFKYEDGYWRWCTRRNIDDDPIAFQSEFDCGTESEINSTHLVYRNALTRNIEAGDVIIGSDSIRTLSMPFGCAWPLNVLVSTSHESDFEIHETIVVESDVAGVGKYEAKMYLYQDENFEEQIGDMPTMDINDNIFIGVELMNADSGVNLVIDRAWATPLPSPYASPFQVPIVDAGCPAMTKIDEMDVKLYANGESSLSTFSTSVFKFTDYEKAYLHAEVKICFDDKNTCPQKDETRCNNSTISERFARSADGTNVVSIGPIYFAKNKAELKMNNIDDFVQEINLINPHYVNPGIRLGKTDVLIAVLLAFVILLSMIVISLYVRWRRATRFNPDRKAALEEVVTVTR